MSETPTLDPQAAAEAADAGIATSDEHALELWKKRADSFIKLLAIGRDEFTADDVWALDLPPNPTGSNTALGARFRAAARKGLIENTGRTTKTAQVQSHAQPVTVWRSLLRTRLTAECPTCHGRGTVDPATLRGPCVGDPGRHWKNRGEKCVTQDASKGTANRCRYCGRALT